jgi:cytosine/adenosine deaminase-related metal-dependent hydrolase
MESLLPAYAYRKASMVADHHSQALKIAVAAGVKIALGTDIFVSGPLYGQNSREVKHLIDAGMSALDAIEAATANGPDTLGPQAPKSGQLVPGYDADILAPAPRLWSGRLRLTDRKPRGRKVTQLRVEAATSGRRRELDGNPHCRRNLRRAFLLF